MNSPKSIIKNAVVEDDSWIHFNDDESLHGVGPFTLSLARFLSTPDGELAEDRPMGIRLPNTTQPEALEGRLDAVSLITIDFPKFTDGRGYTLARDLRVRLKYTGELRAVGDITRDQLLYLSRCGFDSFCLKAGKDPHDGLLAFGEQSVRYQPELSEVV